MLDSNRYQSPVDTICLTRGIVWKMSLPENDRYRLLIDSITDYAIYMLDPNGIVSSWNPGARRFKGYEETEILGQHFSRFYTDEDRAVGVPARALRTAELEGRFEAEGWRVRKDGSRFWAYVIIDPIWDGEGRLIGFAKVTRDLSERRQAEAVLRQSEEQFRLLVQSVTDYAIYRLDPEGNVSSWNAGAQRIKGYTEAEIIGQHFSRFYLESDIAAGLPQTALNTAARDGRFERESWRKRKDGSRFMAHVIIDRILDDDGRLIGFAKVTRDITERVENQRKLDEAREALFQLQKLEAVGRLSAGIAHDFNNLLAAILGGLELLGKRLPDDDDRARKLLVNITNAAERGAALTQRMLAFARRQELEMQPVDVGKLIDGMVDLLVRSIGPSVEIKSIIPPGLPAVSTDPHQLGTAMLNLVINARDAMPQGGTLCITADVQQVEVKASSGPPPGRFVRLTVSDTGTGMDRTTLARAVEPFFTTKDVGKGTGLGLSMVHGLMAQSGGHLTIESQLGAGTRVNLWLPCIEPGRVPQPAAETQHTLATSPHSLRIMVVDDDELVLTTTATMLEDLGHSVATAVSGVDALDRLAADGNYDLIITDQVMPQMTGTELAKRIRIMYPKLPVILASGYAELPEGEAKDVYRLAKPFDQARLSARIASVIEKISSP